MVLLRTVVAAMLALGACSSSDDAPEASGGAPEAQPEPPPPIEPEDGVPSAAALRKLGSLLDEPIEGEDCGTTAADSGWPTTMVPSPDQSDCLVAALSASRAATQTFTGRTHDGEALLTRYVVRVDGTTAVTTHVISPAGEVTSQTVTCEPPPVPWTIGVDGAIVVDNELIC
jgi:hypothetical protein